MNISIINGRVVDPVRGSDTLTAVHISGAKVAAVGSAPSGFVAERVIDAAGCYVLPGLVDLAARLREPGFEYRATLESEMQAAITGGVTSLCCPPDTDPPLDEPGLVEMLKHRARGLSRANLYPLGALTMGLAGEVITEMAELAEAGCIGFSNVNSPIVDTQSLLRSLQYARTFGFTVWVHPQDPHLSRGGMAHSGPVASRLGLSGVPVMAETIALQTLFELIRSTGCRVHLCRMSSAAGLDLVRAAKKEGLPISCDVAVHHIHLIDTDIGYFDSLCRVNPPFRAQRDRDAIRAALRDGTIDAVCSDHTPLDDDAKTLPFGEAEPGTTGLELLLPLLLKWAAEDRVPLATAIAKVSTGAAKILGIERGRIEAGVSADLCVYNPATPWVVEAKALASQGKHTPYLGRELLGRVRVTLVDGQVVFEAGERPAAALR